MARIVIKTEHGSYKITADDVGKKICMCGLSKTQPFCDDAHEKTKDEAADGLYQYDEAGNRTELTVEDEDSCCGGGCCGDDCECDDAEAGCEDCKCEHDHA
jgi:CDGSH-type Zn-finger protein